MTQLKRSGLTLNACILQGMYNGDESNASLFIMNSNNALPDLDMNIITLYTCSLISILNEVTLLLNHTVLTLQLFGSLHNTLNIVWYFLNNLFFFKQLKMINIPQLMCLGQSCYIYTHTDF